MLSAVELEGQAYEELVAHNVKELVPAFNANSIVRASRRALHILTRMHELKNGGMEGTEVSRILLSNLGLLVSKISWGLQEPNKRRTEDKMDQNDFVYKHSKDPRPDEDIHIIGETALGEFGNHHSYFTIFTYVNKVKVVIAKGQSTLSFRPSDADAGQRPRTVASDGDKGFDSTDSDVSFGPSSPPRKRSRRANPSKAPRQMPLPNASRRASSPTAASQPPSPKSARRSSTPMVPRSSPPTRDASHPDHANPSSPLFYIDIDQEIKYMLVNVPTSTPHNKRQFIEFMKKIDVEPRDIKFEALPIETRSRFVYHFSVSTEKEKSAVENCIEKRRWPEQFDVEKMCQDNVEPFLHRSLPMNGIVEVFFLSRVVASPTDEVLYHHLNANMPLTLKNAVKNKDLVKMVMDRLNARGKRIFYNEVKKKATL